MVVIRLSRGGSHKKPFYHIVATEARFKRDGRFIERLGFFDPLAKANVESLRIASDRLDFWIKKGAQPSDRVKKLMKQSNSATVENGV